MTAGFHEVRFPPDISLNSKGGTQRQTDIVTLRSGAEQRNSIWADSRRKYNAGYGVKQFVDAQRVLVFFEERRGRLYGFRWKDHFDCTSSPPGAPITATDQTIGQGDGATKLFQLIKTYGGSFAPWARLIAKPVAGTVVIAIGGITLAPSSYSLDSTTGLVTFAAAPAAGALITAGYQFDVPVRFDADYIEFTMAGSNYGAFDSVPIIEIRI
jgi:uncharacterized protein (TIGR02217 family)